MRAQLDGEVQERDELGPGPLARCRSWPGSARARCRRTRRSGPRRPRRWGRCRSRASPGTPGPSASWTCSAGCERTRCTTQVWTSASGQVARIASGRPFSPSQHTMKTSATPRLRSSVSTVIQNLAPSPPAGPTHMPNTSRSPSRLTPMHHVDGPVGDLAVADLDHDGVDQQHRIDPVQRPVLPGDQVLDDRVGDPARSCPARSRCRRSRTGGPGCRRSSSPWRRARSRCPTGPSSRRCPLGTVTGSKLALRSRGTRSSTGPTSVVTVFG